jgi:hypothetical protein
MPLREWQPPLYPLRRVDRATEDFTVSEAGTVKNLRVGDATHPEFGDALVAALEAWVFARPIENNRTVSVDLSGRTGGVQSGAARCSVRLRCAHAFGPALRAGEIGGARGLDGKLTPIYQVRPEYPRALKEAGEPAGKTETEFVIDREGRVRLPRVVQVRIQSLVGRQPARTNAGPLAAGR